MKKSNVIGIDLAKNILQVCKVSKHGELLTNKAVSPTKLKELLATSPPCIVAMEGIKFSVWYPPELTQNFWSLNSSSFLGNPFQLSS